MSLFLSQSFCSPVSPSRSETSSFRHLPNSHGTRPPSKPLRRMAAGRRQQFNSTCLPQGGVGPVEDETAAFGLLREMLPRHVGLTMDGQRRWAVERGWPNVAGYDIGFRRVHEIVRLCLKLCGIDVLSVFCMSTGNLKRPQVEIDYFCNCLEGFLEDLVQHRFEEKVRISVIGNMERFSKRLQEVARAAEEMTEMNSELHLVLAMGYGGRDDVVGACKSIATKAKAGLADPDKITQEMVQQELKTRCYEPPCPDLLIRPSGEQRFSDYMLFQSAYAELFFGHHSMPDFGEEQFLEALTWFQGRSRRFGL